MSQYQNCYDFQTTWETKVLTYQNVRFSGEFSQNSQAGSCNTITLG